MDDVVVRKKNGEKALYVLVDPTLMTPYLLIVKGIKMVKTTRMEGEAFTEMHEYLSCVWGKGRK